MRIRRADVPHEPHVRSWLGEVGVPVSPEFDEIVIAETGRAVVGCAVADRAFFGRLFVRMLFVTPDQRLRGIGAGLLDAVLEGETGRVFTSTNLSNAAMQALLRGHGWQACGLVHGLDEGDPEVFYYRAPHQG